jgi:ABC-type phosphate/phosphonate transport system substrate-binding protein
VPSTVHVPENNTNSGPIPGIYDPFTSNEPYIGFICATFYAKYKNQINMRLLGVAPVPLHPISKNMPHYLSGVVLRREILQNRDYNDLRDLRGLRFGYNDKTSFSGRILFMSRLIFQFAGAKSSDDVLTAMSNTTLEHDIRTAMSTYFRSVQATNGHVNSLKLLMNDHIDYATIDSQLLYSIIKDQQRKSEFEKKFVIVEWLGPVMIQPIVYSTRSDYLIQNHAALKQSLLDMRHSNRKELEDYGYSGFSEISEDRFTSVVADLDLCSMFDDLV